MEHGHPVAPSNGHQQMLRPHAPVSDEEPRTQPNLRSVMGDEEEHHEKKPMMSKMKDKMRKIKNTVTKKKHGHVDDHDVQDEDEHSVEGEGEAEGYDDADEEMEMEPEIHRAPRYESRATSNGLGGGDKPFTTDSRDEHMDLGTQDSLGGRDDPLPLSSRGEHVPLSSRDDRPVTLASRDRHAPPGGLGSRDGRPVSLGDREERATLGGLQEPPVTPENIDADRVDQFPNGSVSRTDDGNISDPKTGNEQSVSPDILSSFRDMDISSEVDKKPSYTEKPTATAAAVSAASTDAMVASRNQSGETHDQIATPVSSAPGVDVEPREGAGEKKGSYTEKLSSTAVAAKNAAVSAASTVYAKVAGGTHSGETHDQIATPVSTGPSVEVEPREGAGEKKGTYTEKLTGVALAGKDAAMNAATAVYGKVTEKVPPGGGTEQDKGVSVREYLAEKLRPGEDDKALCEVISESMKKKGVEEHEVVEGKESEVKGRIVLPEVTAGEIGVKRVVGKEGRGDGGEGMVKKINGAVSPMVSGGGGSGRPAAAAEGAGGGEAKERAHE